MTAIGYYRRPLKQILIWMFKSRETSNFTYDLSRTNKDYLAAFVADISGRPHKEIAGYIAELEEDAALRSHLMRAGRKNDFNLAASPYGRRLGWYAFVRATKPAVVIETGVHKGLGACVLSAALLKNLAEGHSGRYYGTEINPEAGYLMCGPYADVGEILYGDSINSLKSLGPLRIDVFVNDSDHSPEYERREYDTVKNSLRTNAIILGDNAHCTDELLKFAVKSGRSFLFFNEVPKAHWYPGAGIGVAFSRVSGGTGEKFQA